LRNVIRTGFLVAFACFVGNEALGQTSKFVEVGEDQIPGEYIVILQDDVAPEDVSNVAESFAGDGVEISAIWRDGIKGFAASMSEAQAVQISLDSRVQWVEENAEWHLSSTQQTNIDPKTCDPTTGICPAVQDDRLWHLDRTDQTTAAPTNTYSYCSDGAGVTIYVVDTGVNKFHNEFGPSGTRVKPGFNASGDRMPADDPCMGFAIPPLNFNIIEQGYYASEVGQAGHGTAVASAAAGTRVGVAKYATIVPVKVFRCDQYSARRRLPSHAYVLNETMFRSIDCCSIKALYRATKAGTTGASEPDWTTAPVIDVGVEWTEIPLAEYKSTTTTKMLIDGLVWILSPANPGPKSNAIVTLSTYRLATDPEVAGESNSVEAAIRSLLASNMTVVASANNQNGNACDTSPGRLSANNPDATVANNVITVGGSMIVNRPWTVDISDVTGEDVYEADGGGAKGVEPPYDPNKAVRDARWICGAGDSSRTCSNPTPLSTPNPAGSSATYTGYQGGSNAGPCVTLFAPAKNLFLAAVDSANGYRDARLRGSHSSGTSWSAPIVAGFAARVLQNNPTFSAVQVRTMLLENSVSTLDPASLDTFSYTGAQITGTPNKLLRFGDVNITAQPQSTPAAASGPTSLSLTAGGTSGLSYQWYEVNAGFDYATYHQGAHSSSAIVGATSNSYQAPASSVKKAYWARVRSSCASAESDIAVVVPRPTGAPSQVNASAAGTSVNVTWAAGTGAEKYEVQRKITGQPWTRAGLVANNVFSFTETPSAPGGMALYRVLSVAGDAYLPANNLASSAPSGADFANVMAYTYQAIAVPPGNTLIRAQHLIELRQAVNALCDAAGAPQEYSAAELQLTSLQGMAVKDEDFTSLMAHINVIRTNALVNRGVALFSTPPTTGGVTVAAQVLSLRSALN
jgi:hypothetical protein